MQKMNIDWFNELKLQAILLSKLLIVIEQKMVSMLMENPWILEDINLCESYSHLQEINSISNLDLLDYIDEINLLEQDDLFFEKVDFKDEFDYLKENIVLQLKYIINMENYIEIVYDNTMSSNIVSKRCEEYYDNDNSYLEQMKFNNQQLKILKKERRKENE